MAKEIPLRVVLVLLLPPVSPANNGLHPGVQAGDVLPGAGLGPNIWHKKGCVASYTKSRSGRQELESCNHSCGAYFVDFNPQKFLISFKCFHNFLNYWFGDDQAIC